MLTTEKVAAERLAASWRTRALEQQQQQQQQQQQEREEVERRLPVSEDCVDGASATSGLRRARRRRQC